MSFFGRAFSLAAGSMLLGAAAKAAVDGNNAQAASVIYDPRKPGTFKLQFESYTLGERIMLAEDVAVFRFLLHNPDDEFDLRPCSTLQSQHATGGNRIEQLQRAYTPITPRGTKGYFDIIVKKQHKGRMTEHLFSMNVGESLQFRVSNHKLSYVPNKWKYVGCIAGGTGVSSVLQVIREVLLEPSDTTKCSLLFGNQTEGKILLKGVLDELAAKHKDKFKVHYTIDRVEPENKDTWKGFVGHINAKMIQQTMPPPAKKENLILICGPDSMMQTLAGLSDATLKAMSGGLPHQPLGGAINNHGELGGVLSDLGYSAENVYRF